MTRYSWFFFLHILTLVSYQTPLTLPKTYANRILLSLPSTHAYFVTIYALFARENKLSKKYIFFTTQNFFVDIKEPLFLKNMKRKWEGLNKS